MALKSFRFEQKNYGEKILKDIGTLFDFLNKSDHKQLSDYLISPFFNVNEQCVELYDHLLPLHKRGTLKTNVEALLLKWSKDDEKTKYDINHLLKKAKHLYQHILDFLAHQKIRDNKKDKLQVLQKRLRNQGASKSFEEVSKELYKLVSSAPIGLDRLFDELQVCHLAYFENDMDHEQKGLAFFNVLNAKRIRLSETFKVAYACEMNNLEKAASQKNNTKKIEIFCEREETINLQKLYQLNLAIDQPNDDFSESKFDDFSNALSLVETEINVIDRLILCKYTFNRIMRAINHGQLDLMERLFSWTEKKVKWMLRPISTIKENEFLNVINISVKCDKLKYANAYINEFSLYLPKTESGKRAFFLANAYYFFNEQSYKKVIELIKKKFPKHSDTHFYFMLRSKTLLIKACIERVFNEGESYNDFDLAYDDLHRYLIRKKSIMPAILFDGYWNFHLIILKIKKSFDKMLIDKNDDEVKTRLLALVQDSIPLKSTKWLNEKINTNF